jgi:hypothetical protein
MSRSTTTVWIRSPARTAQDRLWAIVDAPAPPLAATTAVTRPTGAAPGIEKSSETVRTMSSVSVGAIR